MKVEGVDGLESPVRLIPSISFSGLILFFVLWYSTCRASFLRSLSVITPSTRFTSPS